MEGVGGGRKICGSGSSVWRKVGYGEDGENVERRRGGGEDEEKRRGEERVEKEKSEGHRAGEPEPAGAALFFRRAGAGKKARLRLFKNTWFLFKSFSNAESNDDIFTLNFQNFIVLTKFTDSMAS